MQQSPWLGIANKQLELMGRYMTELGMTPAARSRVARLAPNALRLASPWRGAAADGCCSSTKLEAMASRMEPQQ